MPQNIKSGNGNIIKNQSTQLIKATSQSKDSMTVKVVKGGDLRAK